MRHADAVAPARPSMLQRLRQGARDMDHAGPQVQYDAPESQYANAPQVQYDGPESQYATPQVLELRAMRWDSVSLDAADAAPEARYPPEIAMKLSHALLLLRPEGAAALRAALRSVPPRTLQALWAAGRC